MPALHGDVQRRLQFLTSSRCPFSAARVLRRQSPRHSRSPSLRSRRPHGDRRARIRDSL